MRLFYCILFTFLNVFIFQSTQVFSQAENDSLLINARTYKEKKEFSTALSYYLQYQKYHPHKPINLELANFYAEWGFYFKAAELLKKSLHKTDEHYESNLRKIAIWYEQASKLNESIHTYKQLIILHQHNQKQRLSLYIILINLYKKNNQFQESLEIEKLSLELKKQTFDSVGVMNGLNNIGYTYKHLGNNHLALKSFKDSYSYALLLKNEYQQAITLINIAIIGHKSGELTDDIINQLESSVTLLSKLDNKQEIIQALNHLSALYLAKKEYLKAKSLALKSVNYSQKMHNTEGLATAYKLLSKISKELNNANESYMFLNKFSDLKDSLLLVQKIKEQQMQNRQTELGFKETTIKELLVEKEIQDLQFKKLELESQSVTKQAEILKRDQQLQEISFQQNKLQQEKEIYKLQLKNQTIAMLAEKQTMAMLNYQKKKESEAKQNKFNLLQYQNRVNQLELKNQKEILNNEKVSKQILISLLIFIPILILMGFAVYIYRQNAIKSKLNAEFLEVEQRMLRSQMNPHFIFNSLNSIQHFVSISDSYNAEKYFARFSRLMRFILENSAKKEVSLEEEIQMLKLYVELEQLRFSNSFTFEIEMNEDIEPEDTKVPPMLLQAYVENAIVHGLRSKKENGKLKIQFNLSQDNDFVCRIIDNGIGREASQIINAKRIKHNSIASNLNRDRLSLLTKETKQQYSVEFLDLYHPETKEASGTEVIIHLGKL